eukprot:gene2556-2930_t
MALGDSITAAFGEPGWPTIPNFLRAIGSVGASKGDTAPFTKFYPKSVRPSMMDFSDCQLNAAQSMAVMDDVLYEIKYLEESISKVKPSIDVNQDWKLVNYFIGGNDICSACTSDNTSTAQFWSENYYNTLLMLKAKFPRTIVNVMLLPDVSPVGLMGINEGCGKFRRTFKECSCSATESGRKAMAAIQPQYNQIIIDAVRRINALQSSDFAAIIQP